MEALPIRDIHLPDPIGWWPLAPGWWGVLSLLVFTLAGIFWWRHKRSHPRSTSLKIALAELDRLEADDTMPAREKLQQLSILLKRVAISMEDRPTVAGLAGDEWLKWLDQTWPGEARFSQGVGSLLSQGPYRQQLDAAELPQIFPLCRKWLLQWGRKAPSIDAARPTRFRGLSLRLPLP